MTVEISNNGNCIAFWESELDQVTNRLTELEAERLDAEKELECFALWEDLLEAYWNSIKDTNKKVKEGAQEIRLFKRHARSLKDLTACTVEVTQWLFCLIEGYFRCMDQLKKDISELINDIECLNNPDITSSTSEVYKNLDQLNTKLDAAISQQADTLKCALDLIDQARILDESLANLDRKGGRSGLIWLLRKLLQLFRTYQPTTDPKADYAHDGTSYGEGCQEPLVACNAKIEPKPVLPLEYDPYYIETKAQHDEAHSKEEDIKGRVEELKGKEADLAAKANSLEKAIAASTTAKGC